MTKTVFITGDRKDSQIYPGLAAIEMIRALAAGNTIVTGENSGVEAHVRAIAETAGVEVAVIPNPTTMLPNGKPDWDERVARAEEVGVDSTVAIHVDPHTSSIIASLVRGTSDEVLRLVTPADLLV